MNDRKKILLSLDADGEQPPVKFPQLLSEETLANFREFGKSISDQLGVAQAVAASLSETIERSLKPILEGFEKFALAFGRFAPTNWGEDADFEAITSLMLDEGYCLAWVPPEHVVAAMVAGTDRASWDQVLESNSAETLDSVREILGQCNEPLLDDLKISVEEAVDAFESGNTKAAQSLASSCITHVTQAILGHGALADAKREWRVEDEEDLSFAFRLELLGACLSRVFEKTSENLPGFNRHATAHGVDQSAYSEANALNAIMLAAAWTREIQSELDYERKRLELEQRVATGGSRGVKTLRNSPPFQLPAPGDAD